MYLLLSHFIGENNIIPLRFLLANSSVWYRRRLERKRSIKNNLETIHIITAYSFLLFKSYSTITSNVPSLVISSRYSCIFLPSYLSDKILKLNRWEKFQFIPPKAILITKIQFSTILLYSSVYVLFLKTFLKSLLHYIILFKCSTSCKSVLYVFCKVIQE